MFFREFFVESEEGFSGVQFGVETEAGVAKRGRGVFYIEGEDEVEEGAVVIQDGAVGFKESGKFVMDFGTGLIVDFFENIDSFGNGEIGEMVDCIFGREDFSDFFALGGNIAEDEMNN